MTSVPDVIASPHFLVTNDDGIGARGLKVLLESLEPFGDVTALAPDRERSGVSHAFSMNHPLLLDEQTTNRYSLSGTPADCVMFGIRSQLLENKPVDLVFSGINHGANLGWDVIYSGTVAGAREGSLFGKRAVAVSLATEFSPRFDTDHLHFETVAAVLKQVVPLCLANSFPEGVFLSINVPNVPSDQICGIRFTTLGRRIYRDRFIKKLSPDGEELYWLSGEPPSHEPGTGTDFEAMENLWVSITPLRACFSSWEDIEKFAEWNLSAIEF